MLKYAVDKCPLFGGKKVLELGLLTELGASTLIDSQVI